MNNKDFDEIIRKKLESLNTTGTDDAWDLFKEKWNESNQVGKDYELSSKDQDLDEKIKKDMQNLRIPFNSKHWIILKEQLESEALFKKKLFVAKSVELMVLVFLVLGTLNLWPIQNDIYHIPIHDLPMVESIPVNKETAELYQAREEVRLANQKVLTGSFYHSTKKVVEKTVRSIGNLSFNKEASTPSKSLEKLPIKKTEIKSNQKDTKKETQYDIDFPFIRKSIHKQSAESKEILTTKESNVDIFALRLPNDPDELEILIRPTGFPDIVLTNKKARKDEKTFVSLAIGPKINLINSTFDPVYEVKPYNIGNTNFNISAKVHKEVGSLELYTGLGYSNTSYEPLERLPEFHVARPYNANKLKNINFKMFNIPLGVRCNVIDNEKYQFYTVAGVDLNIIANSKYDIQNVPSGGSNPAPFGPPPPPSTASSETKLEQKDINKGIFSGGSLKDNLYASANVGFGVNWSLSSRMGVYIEPKYNHFISWEGIGPNDDKLHGVSVDLGFKYQLN